MRLAVIDLGTHTALLLIADVEGGRFTVVRQEQRIIGLGKGIGKSGRILPESVDLACETLREYQAIIQSMKVQETRLVATAVLRDPANAPEVIATLQERSGIPVTVISGDEEARLIYFAGVHAFPRKRDYTVIDIGGGSVEFVQGSETEIHRLKSLPLGAIKLTERFIHTFPTPEIELLNLRSCLSDSYSHELTSFRKMTTGSIIGIAGTFTTAAAMILKLSEYDPARITGASLTKKDVSLFLDRVATMSLEEQKRIPGLHPKRAGYIVAGLAIIESFFDWFGTTTITVSDLGLRFGVLLDWMQSPTVSHKGLSEYSKPLPL